MTVVQLMSATAAANSVTLAAFLSQLVAKLIKLQILKIIDKVSTSISQEGLSNFFSFCFLMIQIKLLHNQQPVVIAFILLLK